MGNSLPQRHPPGEVLPNGQIVGPETGLVETLEAIKPYYDEAVKNGEPSALPAR